MEEKLIKKRFDPEKRFMELGKTKIDLARLCRDARGVEDDLRQAIKEDWGEARYNDWDTRLYPFAEASDLVVQDDVPSTTIPPCTPIFRPPAVIATTVPATWRMERGSVGLISIPSRPG